MAHGLKCYYCGENPNDDKHYLCYDCVKKLRAMFDNNEAIIENPSFVHHCVICGAHENRKIIFEMIPVCDKCVVNELLDYEQA